MTQPIQVVPAKEEPTNIWSRCCRAISATFRDVKCLCLILKHPETPWHIRIVLFFPIAYVCSPIQIFPNFIPVFGQLDDLFVIWIANRLVLRFVSEKIRIECLEKAATTKLASLFATTTGSVAASTHPSEYVA